MKDLTQSPGCNLLAAAIKVIGEMEWYINACSDGGGGSKGLIIKMNCVVVV